jgi:hypothetical protein
MPAVRAFGLRAAAHAAAGPRSAAVGAAIGLLAAASLAAPASAAAAAPSVSSPAYAHPGGTVPIVVRDRHRGRVTVALSTDRHLGRGDIVLERRLALRGRPASAVERLTVPAATAPTTYRLLVCATHKRCATRTRLHVTAAPVSTRELTDAAVAAHKLTVQRALVFRVWSTFGDRRLPAAYRGDADGAPDDGVLAEAVAARLRGKDRRAVAPYLLPPIARAGWVLKGAARAHASAAGPSRRACETQATSKHWRALTGKHVRVWWWREHAANRKAAASLVRVADKTIWPAFAKLMGRTPPSDAGSLCDGGDGHYDIYLLPEDIVGDGTFRAVTLPFGPHCTGGPSFTEVDTHGGNQPPTRFELAHELFHAFQNAFPSQGDCAAVTRQRWFDEASAVWASTWLFPHEDGAHPVPTLALEQPFCSIDIYSYDAFPFVLDIQRRYGDATVPKAYGAFARADTLHGLDKALPGGFAATWRTFTRDAWNQDPAGAPFAAWYGIPRVPAADGAWCGNPEPRTLELHGAHAYRTPIHLGELASLTRRYDDLHFAEGVHEVIVHNHTVGDGRSDLQAFLQMSDGSWQIRDLTATPETRYCLDTAGQRVRRMVLAYGDHSIDNSRSLNTPGLIPPSRGIPDSYEHGLTIDVRDSCARFEKVTAVSGTIDYTAHYSANRYHGDTCTATGIEHSAVALDPAGHLGATDGRYFDGSLVLSIPTRTTGSLDYHSDGCDFGGSTRCHVDIDETGGPLASGVGDAGAPALDVQVGALGPHLLNGCAGTFKDADSTSDIRLITTSVPTAALAADQPFTLSFSATVSDAERTIARTLAVTVSPVAEDGAPLRADTRVEGPIQ